MWSMCVWYMWLVYVIGMWFVYGWYVVGTCMLSVKVAGMWSVLLFSLNNVTTYYSGKLKFLLIVVLSNHVS